MRNLASALMAGACALALCGSALAEEPKAPATAEARAAKPGEADIARAPVQEQARTSRGSVTVGGKAIAYTATAGTLTLREDDGKPTASMFYVAYVADRPKGAPERPVTFFFNGGPGSSTMWLHMGSFGPVVVKTNAPAPASPLPAEVIANKDSLLDKSDLVFLDAIGAGYSRPLGDTPGSKFWGVDQDIDAFARAISRYVTINNRWNAPKFIFGESYGTTRAAGLVNALQEEGMAINGVMLLSSILNYGVRNPGFDRIYQTYLPSFAATAAYHGKLASKPADLNVFLKEVRDYANGPYGAALARGTDLPEAEAAAVARQLSAYTGLSVEFIRQADLRIDLSRFRKELLRDQRRTVGRLDSRFIGIDVDAAGEAPEYDASDVQVSGPYTAAVNSYLKGTLGYTTDLAYFTSGPGVNAAWDWRHKPPGSSRNQPVADTAQDLAAAMRQNPKLKVMSLNGYYDMATPFFGAEYDIAHMQLDPALRANVRFTYYASGHMIYLNLDDLARMKADLAKFYDDAAR